MSANYIRKHLTRHPYTPSWEWPGQPWSRIHIDYAGLHKGEMFLVIVDAYSKWLDVHIMKSTTSTATIEKLREVFATRGLPRTVVSDNGPQFTSAEFAEFMVKNGIRHTKVSPYHPASNGQAEPGVRIFKEGVEKMEGGSTQSKLSRFLLRYRVTPHSTTGVPPVQLPMKRHLSTKLDLVRPSVENRVLDKQTQQKSAHNRHARERVVEVDDSVLVRDFREKKAWMPGTVKLVLCPRKCSWMTAQLCADIRITCVSGTTNENNQQQLTVRISSQPHHQPPLQKNLRSSRLSLQPSQNALCVTTNRQPPEHLKDI